MYRVPKSWGALETAKFLRDGGPPAPQKRPCRDVYVQMPDEICKPLVVRHSLCSTDVRLVADVARRRGVSGVSGRRRCLQPGLLLRLSEVDVTVDGLVDGGTPVQRLRLERLAERRNALQQRLQVAEVCGQRLGLVPRRRDHLHRHRTNTYPV